MHILVTVHQFFPQYHAGTEVLALGVARELRDRGHQVSILTGHPGGGEHSGPGAFDHYTYDGFEIDRFHDAHPSLQKLDNRVEAEYNNPVVRKFVQDRLAHLKPDLVHAFHFGRLSASVIAASKARGVPVLFTASDFWMVCPTNQLLLPDQTVCAGPDPNALNCMRHLVSVSQPAAVKERVDRAPRFALQALLWASRLRLVPGMRGRYLGALARRSRFLRARASNMSKVLVPTGVMREVLLRNGFDEDQLAISPYGIETSGVLRTPLDATQKKLRIGFMGTLFHHKGAHVLIEAIRQIPSDVPLEVQIYGNLSDYPSYVRLLLHLAREDPRISFLGHFPSAEIGRVLSGIDLLVVPSVWPENAPLVAYYAQAAGRPLVVSDVGGLSDQVIHGENGLVFPRGDSAALAAALTKLATDRELLVRLGGAARPPRSVANYVDELEGHYRAMGAN